jgi:hypothetical protein
LKLTHYPISRYSEHGLKTNCGSLIQGRRLPIAAATLRGSRAAFALKKKKENQEKAGNREAREKSRDQVQRVMYY